VKIVRHGCVAGGALEGHRSMNRISIRGVGTAAAALAVTALAVGGHTPAADAQEAVSLVSPATSHSLSIMSTNENTDIVFPARLAGIADSETASGELLALHSARGGGLAAASAASAAAAKARAAAANAAKAAKAAASRKARTEEANRSSRSAVRPVYSGSVRALGQQLAAARGWTGVQWQCLDSVWTHESGWGITAENPSGAYGIPQASPGSKMASAGSDWRTNPATQIQWGLSYIANAYGNPCAAWSFWQSHYWY
jgi:hypothetical protein